ncbi:MAG TPA: hypothetical protein VFO93_02285 [Hymenobacter sp.]|uniref:hypothetical protein n=1 Tax=Hymenobacter sp. TaxID=1898978 RepID=UPI002D7E334C|nr:hypothetical protein [Hymenobacter sp.]HET9502341.1 hypothetical protein [Hymenobacter sp.]
MKTSLFKTILFSMLLVLLGQCTSDRPQNLIAPRSTAEQLASNADFVEIVKITNHFQDVIYNNLRDAHSDKVRQLNSQRINSLLNNRQNKDSLILAINYLGFKDFNQFLVDLNKINSLGVKLNKSGICLAKVPSQVLIESFATASKELGHTYPVIFARGGGFCPDCHFNNCDECGPGQDGEESTDDEGDGPGYSCRANAEAKKANAIAQAENTCMLAVIACGGSGWAAGELACGATMVTIVGAPISPGVGVGVGCFVFTTCTAFAYADYRLKIQQAELDYQAAIAGCPK